MIYFIGFVLLIYCVFYGCYANPFWKLHEYSSYYANGLFRAAIGLPALVAVVFLMLGDLESFFGGLLATATFAAIPLIRMRKDGILNVKSVHLLIMASIGAWARIILAFTGIGLIVTSHTKRAAEIGWEGAAVEWMKSNANQPKTKTPSMLDVMLQPSEKPESYNPKPEMKVYIEQDNGNMKQVQVNSDNSMYKDPDTGEWVKIKK